MIITRTPYRISFFGGGTDYPTWWQEHGGSVLATSIEQYCYITCTPRLPFFDFKHLISWSRYEAVQTLDEIEHPSVREVLRFMGTEEGFDIRTIGQLPARSGLGTSSAFTVGLLKAMHGLNGNSISQLDLAKEAIHVEQNLIKEAVGCQDQVLTAVGGLNRVGFASNGSIDVNPLTLSEQHQEDFESHLLLVWTGIARNASEVAQVQIEQIRDRTSELKQILAAVDEGEKLLMSADWTAFGKLLHEAWQIKRSLTSKISSPAIDEIYDTARGAGAIGGKLIGAGGGGFMLLFIDPERRPEVKESLDTLLQVDVKLNTSGTETVHDSGMHSN
jgi:D-glycero-alpha-D-manno-heptose-7-phosphate kinase